MPSKPIDLEKISESPHLLDILLQMEDVLDSLDIYVFKNWYLGEIAEGPTVRRYWLDFTLKYPLDKMPDPKAALRLLKHGIRVDFWKAKLMDGAFKDAEDDAQDAEDGKVGVGDHSMSPTAPTQPTRSQEFPADRTDQSVPGAAMPKEKDPAKDTIWLVHISIPRRLVAQMSAEEMDFYDDEVDTDDVEDAKDAGIDNESAFKSDEQQGEMPPPPNGGANG